MARMFTPVVAGELESLEGFTLSNVTEKNEITTVVFTKQIDNVLIGCEVMFDGEEMYMSQEYVVDIYPKNR